MGVSKIPPFQNGGDMNISFVRQTLEEMIIHKSQYDLRKKKLIRFLRENIKDVPNKSEILEKLDEYLVKKRPIRNDALLSFGIEEILEKNYGGSSGGKDQGETSKVR